MSASEISWEILELKWSELGLLLRRKFWKPLRSMMDIFHVLPIVAVVILFVLLATDGQFREIYIAYLEGAQHITAAWVVSVVVALAVLALISAILYEAHYALSTMRLNVVYSSSSNPKAASKLRSLQHAAAFILAFLPWFGLTLGLFGARNFVANRYCALLNVAGVDPGELFRMQYLPLPDGWTIAGALLLLGLAAAYFSSVGEQNNISKRVVGCCAPPLAALLFMLITDRLEANATSRSLVAVVLVGLGTVAYFAIYQWLFRRRGGFVFIAGNSGTGISPRKRRRRLLAVWSFLPWLSLAIYFVAVQRFAPAVQLAAVWPDCPVASAVVPVPGHWAAFPVAMCGAIAFGLMVGHLLGRFSTNRWRLRAIFTAVAVLAIAVEALSFFGSVDTMVATYRFIGPLGTVFLQLLFLISTFALLAALSQRSGFPALTLIVLTMVICVIFPNYAKLTAAALGLVYFLFALTAFVSGRIAVGIVALLLIVVGAINFSELNPGVRVKQNGAAEKADASNVQIAFLCWLDRRDVQVTLTPEEAKSCPQAAGSRSQGAQPGGASGKYTVFIVAAEGGGIYAASAVSTFMAKLQDVEPRFAEHVFAISGVSGGSIGAAIFQALDHAQHPDPNVPTPSPQQEDAGKCTLHSAAAGEQVGSTLTDKVASIMQADHFSPVVGSIFPEIFGAPLKRPDALVASFEYSASTQDGVAGLELCAPFAQHWSAASLAPALVLNSTWVEMGFRVAFAPFHLHDIDESLYSFSDQSMPDEHETRLMEAAGVSARFPLIMPPFSATMTDGKHWNFVDGAYSDNSGATTALDIYRAIEDVAPSNVDLRIVLITSSDPQPNLKDQSINGTVFRDTIAPIDALMKVREDLGNDAVARACTYIYHDEAKDRTDKSASRLRGPAGKGGMEVNETCIDHAGSKDGPLQIVEIQDQTYGLPLGWKISGTSFSVVSWMLGEPNKCPGLKPQSADVPSSESEPAGKSDENENAQLTNAILERNSCVLKLIVDLVRDAPAPSTPANRPGNPVR